MQGLSSHGFAGFGFAVVYQRAGCAGIRAAGFPLRQAARQWRAHLAIDQRKAAPAQLSTRATSATLDASVACENIDSP